MYSNDSQHNETNKGTIVMTDNQIKDFLNSIYSEAMNKASGKDTISSNLPQNIQNSLNTILLHSENSKAVLAVTMTSLVYKHFNPCQDIRKHQQSIEGGYSGRTFDTKFITPFLKECPPPDGLQDLWNKKYHMTTTIQVPSSQQN